MRKLWFSLLFLVSFLFSCGNTKTPDQVKPDILEKTRASTVAFVDSVVVVDEGADENKTVIVPYCAGFWINESTLLTALHCARAAAKHDIIKKLPRNIQPYVGMFIQEPENPISLEMSYTLEEDITELKSIPKMTHKSIVIAIDSDHDMAMLQTEAIGRPNHQWLPIANSMPKVGDRVFIVGHQNGLYFTCMDGMISALRTSYDNGDIKGPFIQVYSSIYLGNSGGPIVSDKGELLGLISFISVVPNQGFGIATPSINAFVKKH